jgi:hypothetical protein
MKGLDDAGGGPPRPRVGRRTRRLRVWEGLLSLRQRKRGTH